MKRTFLKIILAMILTVWLSNSATAAELTFGDWAIAQGYTPPGPINWKCSASSENITSADGANSYTNLQSLNLYRNQISSLSANQFQNLTNLLELNLVRNQISSISADQFQGLTNLQKLLLADNQISSLSANQFQYLTNLQHLDVGYNPIGSIDPNVFQGLSNLTTFCAEFMPLSSLCANQFQGLGSLEDLSFQGSQISSIDPNAFQGLGNVWELMLRHNQLSSLSANQFQGLTNLLYLDLEGNPISSLSANAFQGLDNLQRLYLGFNQISVLDLTGFELSALTGFDIKENPLTGVILADATLSQVTFNAVIKGHETNSFYVGIADLAGVASVDFIGADMSGVDQLDAMFAMGDLETLILTDVVFSNAIITAGHAEVWDLISALEAQQLDALTVDEQLYAAMQTDLDAWDAGADNVLTVVPEPAMLSLLALGACLRLLRRRR